MKRAKLEVASLPANPNSWIPYRYGLRLIGVLWQTNGRDQIEQNTGLPFIEYQWSVGPKRRDDKLRVEYEQAWHRNEDFDRAVFNDAQEQTLDHRANVTYDFMWPIKKARISLTFTFDLDRFGTGETWEGGAGQAQFTF